MYKKKRRTVIAVILVGVLVAGASYVFTTHRENINALKIAVNTSTEDIDAMVKNQNDKIKDIITQFPAGINITPEAINEAVQTKKDAAKQDQSVEQPEVDYETEEPIETPKVPTESPPAPVETVPSIEPEKEVTAEERVALEITERTAELYIQKDYYIGLLDALEQKGLAELRELSPEDRKGDKLVKLALRYYNEASKLEMEADEVVVGIIAEIEVILLEYGGDTSLCDEIFQTYTDEKTLKKAQYMSKYKDYLSGIID